MNSAHLAIIAAMVIALMTFISGYDPQDFAGFQRTINHSQDFQAYQDRPLLDDYNPKR